jgi:YggT family protein
MLIRALNTLLALYMLLILIRWLGAWLELDVHSGRLRWIPMLTDPVIAPIRRILPPMGPLDFGPIATLFVVWLVRIIVLRTLIPMSFQ